MPRPNDVLTEFATFEVGPAATGGQAARASVSSIQDVAYLRSVTSVWNTWSLEHGRPTSQFNWVSVFNFDIATNALTLVLDVRGAAQTLMHVRVGHIVRCDAGARRPLVYVGFLETAPWNRSRSADRQFRGLGPIMLGIACELSFQAGHEGRIGLHSLETAEEFYRKFGFRSVDCPNEFHELYLELDEPAAQAMCRAGR